jgi:hypothetical protein
MNSLFKLSPTLFSFNSLAENQLVRYEFFLIGLKYKQGKYSKRYFFSTTQK